MQFCREIFNLLLFNFANGPGCSSHSDQGKSAAFQPGHFFQLCGDQFFHDLQTFCSVLPPQFGEVGATKWNAGGFDDFPVLHKSDFRGSSALVKDDSVLLVDGVQHAETAQARFLLSGNNLKADAGFFADLFCQRCTVMRIADGRCGHCHNIISSVKTAHEAEIAQTCGCRRKSLVSQIAVPVGFHGKPQRLFLAVNKLAPHAVGDFRDDQTRRV